MMQNRDYDDSKQDHQADFHLGRNGAVSQNGGRKEQSGGADQHQEEELKLGWSVGYEIKQLKISHTLGLSSLCLFQALCQSETIEGSAIMLCD